MGDELEIGDWVKVRGDCPHTLPSYARMLNGQVLGPLDDGSLEIRFGEGKVFPIAAKWLMRVDAPTIDDDAPE